MTLRSRAPGRWNRLAVLSRLAALLPLLAVLLAAGGVVPVRAEVPVPPMARVTDLSRVLNSSRSGMLEWKLEDLERRLGSQVAVLILPTTEPETIEQYGARVAKHWKLGRKGVDDGVLVLVTTKTRKVHIEVGHGLKRVLPDATAKHIIGEMIVPGFEKSGYGEGLHAGANAIIAAIDGERAAQVRRGHAADVQREEKAGAQREKPTVATEESWWIHPILGVFIAGLIVLVFNMALSGFRRRHLRPRLVAGSIVAGTVMWGFSGWVIAALGAVALTLLIQWLAANQRSGSASDWDFGTAGFSGGGVDTPGFAGGGGGFGGGGASGSWDSGSGDSGGSDSGGGDSGGGGDS